MSAIPFGKIAVPVPGTPVALVTALDANGHTKHISIHGIMFEVWPTNTGLMYVGLAGMNKTTGANVLAILSLPSFDSNGDPVFLPTFSLAITIAPNGLAAEGFYIDADDVGNSLLVTGIQA